MTPRAALLIAGLLGAAALVPAHATGPAPTARPALSTSVVRSLASSRAAVVEILTLRLAGRPDLWDNPERPRDEFAAGAPAARRTYDAAHDVASGLVIGADGLILTSAHVVSGVDEVQALLADGRRLPARIVGLDADTDVALLRIDATGLAVASIGDSSTLAPGDPVFAIGSPFGFHGSVTAGIVSARDRRVPGAGPIALIQTDVATNPGSSGGPLLNLRGEVVGINSVIYSGSGGYMGVSFAVPINLAMKIAAQLGRDGKVVRPHLGVETQDVTPALAQAFRLPPRAAGALVLRVEAASPAAAAGLAAGDILLAVDGSEMAGVADLLARIDERLPGTRSVLKLWRRGAALTLPVTLAGRGSIVPSAAAAPAPEWRQGLGLELTEPSVSHLLQLRAANGLLVQEAVGPARSEGVRAGDLVVAVNDEPVARIADFQRLLEQAASGSTVALLVQRDGRLTYVPVRMPALRAP